jgi:hypothetical protein
MSSLWNRLLTFLTLFSSFGTLLCCALPALLVTLGLGAALAGMISQFPQLIWVSEHKTVVFSSGALFLVLGGLSQWHARNLPCPIDPEQAKACASSRRWAKITYSISVSLYLIGTFFAFGAAHIF